MSVKRFAPGCQLQTDLIGEWFERRNSSMGSFSGMMSSPPQAENWALTEAVSAAN
jgi:hypothetical protein